MTKDISLWVRSKVLEAPFPLPRLIGAMEEVRLRVDRVCLLAGNEALQQMMEDAAAAVCGARHRRHADRRGYRWGRR